MILLVDNYDSFVHNLARYVRQLGMATHVVRNDQIDDESLAALKPSALVLSPGPCTPQLAGQSLPLVRRWADELPMLGICLGHQVIVDAFGGQVVRAKEPVHGRTSEIFHDSSAMFANVPSPFRACRYHSLVGDRETLPDCLRVTAWTSDSAIMAVEHRERPIVGLQFHPESILTPTGSQLLQNFFQRFVGIDCAAAAPAMVAADESVSGVE